MIKSQVASKKRFFFFCQRFKIVTLINKRATSSSSVWTLIGLHFFIMRMVQDYFSNIMNFALFRHDDASVPDNLQW
jgi:hypothetical protein